jgi:4-hydroxy-2-oxovalerate aldolase
MDKTPPQILECTLRDGAYAVKFAFTEADTFRFARRLDDLGFPLIEVGHGVGLGASTHGQGRAAATDTEYMKAAASAVRHGKWGMFCIPGIASIEDVNIAADHGAGFIRVGTEVTEVEKGKAFVEAALARGMVVYCNLMKSYTAAPDEFARQAKKCIDYGATAVYLVDSAGGMVPNELRQYADATRRVVPDARLGFHGHNNLGMAVANSLFAADYGFSIVDTSLQGLGRSSGNTPTSQLLSILLRAGYDIPYDVVDVMEASETLARPYKRDHGYDTLEMTLGLGLFHSGFLSPVLEAATERNVDPRRVILALCKRDRLRVTSVLIDQAIEEVLNTRSV